MSCIEFHYFISTLQYFRIFCNLDNLGISQIIKSWVHFVKKLFIQFITFLSHFNNSSKKTTYCTFHTLLENHLSCQISSFKSSAPRITAEHSSTFHDNLGVIYDDLDFLSHAPQFPWALSIKTVKFRISTNSLFMAIWAFLSFSSEFFQLLSTGQWQSNFPFLGTCYSSSSLPGIKSLIHVLLLLQQITTHLLA